MPAAIETLRRVWAPLLTLAVAAALRVKGGGALENASERLFDKYQALRPRAYAPAPVRVVDVDEESLSRLGPWPWPRSVTARLVARLDALGAASVGFNFVYPERDLHEGGARNDRAFAVAVKKTRGVVGFVLNDRPDGRAPEPGPAFARDGDADPLDYLPDYKGAQRNIAELEAAAVGAGVIDLVPERDGVVRRVPLVFKRGGTLYPSLALETLRAARGDKGFTVRAERGRGIRSVSAGALSLPTDAEGRARVYLTGDEASRAIPAWKILEPGFPAENVRGSAVLLGSSAGRMQDLRATALSPLTPGVEVQASVAEQALLGRFLSRPSWAGTAELVFALLACGGLIALLPRAGALWCGALALGLVAASAALSWLSFSRGGLLIDPIFPAAAASAVYVAAALAEYMRAEAERRRLAVLDQVKDEMIAMVSHDLRGPVSTMIMAVELMSTEPYGPIAEGYKKKLGMIKDAGLRLNGFVTNILDAAKIKAGKMQLARQRLRLKACLSPLTEFFALSASIHSLTLDVLIPDDLPELHADREKLEQVVNNLVGNAMKFTPRGGKITLAAERDGAFVRISVTDTGKGISKEDAGKLFQTFSQVDLLDQRDKGVVGSGLGLSICRTVVEAHGGRIWVESEPGKGASFRFTMPTA